MLPLAKRSTIRAGLAALALTAGLAIAPAAWAAKGGSPACGLIGADQASQALGGPAAVDDSGPGKAGYSDCAWRNGGRSSLASLILWSPEHFANGGPDAAAFYDGQLGGQRRRGRGVVPLPALGERAAIATEGAGDLEAYTVTVLRDGAVIQLSSRGIARSAAIDLAKAAASRLGDGPEAADQDIPVPRPKPVTPETAAIAQPEAAGPADRPAAAATQPAPAEAPPPPAPPPAPKEGPPGEVPTPPERRGPAAADTASAACRILAPQDLKLIKVAFRRSGESANATGESTCEWQAADGAIVLSATLLEGQAITGTAPNAAAYFAGLEQPATGNGVEVLDDVGQQATLRTTGEGGAAFLAFAVRANEKILFLTVAGVQRTPAIALAQAAARRM